MPGPLTTADLALLTGYDADALNQYHTQDGISFAEIAEEVELALTQLNNEVYTNPFFSSIVSYSDQPTVTYENGDSNGFDTFTELSQADESNGDIEGHMLPLKALDKRLGWTWNYLRSANSTEVRQRVAGTIRDARHTFRKNILTRLYQRGDDTGKSKGLGATGISPGFVTAAANTGVDFTPPNVHGISFDSDHEHYVGVAGGAFTKAIIEDMEQEIKEHGHSGTYNLIVGSSDESTVRGLAGFAAATNGLYNFGSSANVSVASMSEDSTGSYFVGAIANSSVRVVPGIPQYYGTTYKSYGANDLRNPIRIRLPKGHDRPMVVAMRDPRAGGAAYALQHLMMFTEFGVGVGDRTAATSRFVNNATWSDGVVS